jgi:hypothetical protein
MFFVNKITKHINTTSMTRIIKSIFLLGIFVVLFSCKDEDTKISTQHSTAVQDESVTDAYFNDASDMSTSALAQPSGSDISGGRGKGVIEFTVTGDTRFNGSTVRLQTAANSTVLNPRGTITIDFGTGKTDPSGTIRKGKIIITYAGLRFIPGSNFIVTFDGYFVNGMKVEGTRTVTTASVTNTSITFTVKDENGKATFMDGTFITRVSNHTRRWVRGTTLDKNQWEIEGTASGTTRDSKSYQVVISRALVVKVQCALNKIFIPSEGEAVLTVDNLPITLNYGVSGAACDHVITVTIAGITQDVTVN